MEEEALCLDCEDPDAKQLTEAKAARLSPAEPEPVELAPVASASSRGTTMAAAEAARERHEAARRILRFMVMKKQERKASPKDLRQRVVVQTATAELEATLRMQLLAQRIAAAAAALRRPQRWSRRRRRRRIVR